MKMKIKQIFEDSSERNKKLLSRAMVKLQFRISNLKNHIKDLNGEARQEAEKRLKKYEDELVKWNRTKLKESTLSEWTKYKVTGERPSYVEKGVTNTTVLGYYTDLKDAEAVFNKKSPHKNKKIMVNRNDKWEVIRG
jgi:hypothetical protein